LYAVNYAKRHTIGKITPDGQCTQLVELTDGGTGCGMRFDGEDSLLVADHTLHRILRVNVDNGKVTVFASEARMHQPNDLAIASNGMLFASDPNWSEANGQLWRIDPDGRTVLLEANMGTTNGIEISPDERTLYVNETLQRRVWAYDLAPDGSLANKRLLIEFAEGGLDGMRCDMSGALYITRYGAGRIAKLSPWGDWLMDIPLIGSDCTNVTFGGPDGRTCYATMADNGNIERFRTECPGRCWALLGRKGNSW
jgi:sugar lactone lactonase YvrE